MLIITFVFRLHSPTQEHYSRGLLILDILANIGLLIGLYGTKRVLLQRAPDDDRWKIGAPLYWAALISGLGLILFHFRWNGSLAFG